MERFNPAEWNSLVRVLLFVTFGGSQVEKAPLESYADVGGLEAQIQEIKEAVELPLTHPEVYEDIGIKPPKVTFTYCSLLHRPSSATRSFFSLLVY
jgi:hypothetical protein